MTKAAAAVITHEVYRRTSLLFWRHTTSGLRPNARTIQPPTGASVNVSMTSPRPTTASDVRRWIDRPVRCTSVQEQGGDSRRRRQTGSHRGRTVLSGFPAGWSRPGVAHHWSSNAPNATADLVGGHYDHAGAA